MNAHTDVLLTASTLSHSRESPIWNFSWFLPPPANFQSALISICHYEMFQRVHKQHSWYPLWCFTAYFFWMYVQESRGFSCPHLCFLLIVIQLSVLYNQLRDCWLHTACTTASPPLAQMNPVNWNDADNELLTIQQLLLPVNVTQYNMVTSKRRESVLGLLQVLQK